MTKITIEGMMCKHCAKKVEDKLNELGKDVTVDLENKFATVNSEKTNEELTEAIEDLGYDVVKIETI